MFALNSKLSIAFLVIMLLNRSLLSVYKCKYERRILLISAVRGVLIEVFIVLDSVGTSLSVK